MKKNKKRIYVGDDLSLHVVCGYLIHNIILYILFTMSGMLSSSLRSYSRRSCLLQVIELSNRTLYFVPLDGLFYFHFLCLFQISEYKLSPFHSNIQPMFTSIFTHNSFGQVPVLPIRLATRPCVLECINNDDDSSLDIINTVSTSSQK